jgi:hypothetical protein
MDRSRERMGLTIMIRHRGCGPMGSQRSAVPVTSTLKCVLNVILGNAGACVGPVSVGPMPIADAGSEREDDLQRLRFEWNRTRYDATRRELMRERERE